MKKFRLALDWTPNINHIGFFVSLENNFYKEHGIDLEIVNPLNDNYSITPAKKIELNIVEFALCPTETLISYHTKKNKLNLLGIAAILKKDLSAIVVTEDSKINSPKDLDGKSYSSFNARYEDHIIRQMIINDGGKGDVKFLYPDKLGIWDTIIKNNSNSTWIFMNWEGIQASELETRFRYFKMEDYMIPYSYSPVLVCNRDNLNVVENANSFIKASRKGFIYSFENKKESLKILKKYIPDYEKNINLEKCYDLSIPSMNCGRNWGEFDFKKVQIFLDWIKHTKIEKKIIKVNDIITNEYF
tara:strand:- start:58 stop:960 length:903 start_codon:yes stop_codon:yes gene_type:complete